VSKLLLLWLFDLLLRFFLLFGFRLASFKELLLLLPSYFFVLSHFDILFDGLRSLIVEVSSQFFMELFHYMRLIKLILNTRALRLLDLSSDIIKALVDFDSSDHVDLVEMIHPTDDDTVGISLQIKEGLQLLLESVGRCINSMGFELLT